MQQQNFINGVWQHGSGEPFVSTSPIDNHVVWQGNASSSQDIDAAVTASKAAFASWARTPIAERIAVVKKYQDLLKQHSDTMAELIHRETGKPLWESKTEAATMIGKVDLSIAAQAERAGDSEKQIAAGTALLGHRPHGTVAVFGPYNFPGHLPNGHIVPALLAGNCVLFKPSEHSPAVAELMMSLWQQAGLPNGVIALLQGARDSGTSLAAHAHIDGLFFTGSSATGEILHRQFGGQPGKILALEMGGNNPLIVYQPGELRAAVYNTIQSAFISAGQRCTCARRLIIVDDQQGQEFLAALVQASQKIKVSADGEGAFCGPVISIDAADKLLAAQDDLLARGAQALLPMRRLGDGSATVTPAIIDVTDVAALEDNEHFGPLLQVIRVANFDQAIEVANDTKFGLAAGLFCEDQSLWQEFYLRSRAGIVNWNKQLTGASGAAPFGGIGASGNHRASAWYAADYCAYPVASLVANQLELPETFAPGIEL